MKKISIYSIYSIYSVLFVYFIFAIATLFLWKIKDINNVTGDEPHYLIKANGIIKYRTFDITKPYIEEFKTRKIMKSGLRYLNPGETDSPRHYGIVGPNGIFGIHNIGLPLLLAIPYMLGGVVGAKIFMVFCGAIIIFFGWEFSSFFSKNKRLRFWAIIATGISLPLIAASNQIYPDMLSGLITLVGLYWFFTTYKKRSKIQEILLSTIIAFLPWLHIKLSATCILIILAVTIKIYLESKNSRRVLRIFLITSTSCILLLLYNHYAFGNILGIGTFYKKGIIELGKENIMILLGLLFDQNQGFLLLNPVNLIGILAIGWIYRFNHIFALFWGLVFLSLIIPNALHLGCRYGGTSFSGRFEWGAAVIFIIPTIYGLLIIGKNREKTFRLIIAGGILLQLYFFYQYAIRDISLYNRGAATWIENYSIFYSSIHPWLPMLYNSEWEFKYLPNYTWLALICTLLLIGFIRTNRFYSKASILIISCFVLILVAGLFKGESQMYKIIFRANELPSQAGRIINSTRIAEQYKDSPGLLNFGPYFLLGKGQYEVTLIYSALGSSAKNIGWFDVFNATLNVKISQLPINGTHNTNQALNIKFKIDHSEKNLLEFRTYWNGLSTLKVQYISLRKL